MSGPSEQKAPMILSELPNIERIVSVERHPHFCLLHMIPITCPPKGSCYCRVCRILINPDESRLRCPECHLQPLCVPCWSEHCGDRSLDMIGSLRLGAERLEHVREHGPRRIRVDEEEIIGDVDRRG